MQGQTAMGTSNAHPTALLELKSSTKGFLPSRLSTIQRNAILSPATGLVIYNSDKNCIEWYNGTAWYNGCGVQDSSGGTAIISGCSTTSVARGTLTAGSLAVDVTQAIIVNVTMGGAYNIRATANGVTFTGSGILMGTGPQNIVLKAEGISLAQGVYNFELNLQPGCSFSREVEAGAVVANAICNKTSSTMVVPITSVTGKVWMDRNLGASRAGISVDDYQAFGCLYQWGRGNDGHASVNWTSPSIGRAVNGVTDILFELNTAPDALFITTSGAEYDWRYSQNDALWQGVSGVNNPCPAGYRLPAKAEFEAEIAAYGITNPATAYGAPHKFVTAGYRDYYFGEIYNSASELYWTSSVWGTQAYQTDFILSGHSYRSYGFSVRCIKD